MSMRATFTTEFIYDGSDGYLERKAKMCEILNTKMDLKSGTVIGQISGITSGLDLEEEDIRRWVLEFCYELMRITIIPFKIVWLFENGDVLMKKIHSIKGGI